MSTQSEALRLADICDGKGYDAVSKELRRLHEENEHLRSHQQQKSIAVHQWRRVDQPRTGWFDDTHERAYHADPKIEGRTLYSIPKTAQQQEPPDGCVVVARAILRKLGIDDDVIDTIARPTAQQQEPVAQVVCDPNGSNKRVIFKSYKALHETPLGSFLHTSPPAQPSKPWVGLTEDEQDELVYEVYDQRTRMELAIGIEAKLREKNT